MVQKAGDGTQQISRKEREEAFRRDLVLDAAEELFAEKGFDGTTVADIAQASELAKGSLYQLFESKEEIITAVIKRKIDQMQARLDRILAEPVSPTEKIRNLIDAKLRTVGENRRFARIFFHEMRGFHWCIESPLMHIYRQQIAHLLERVEDVLREGQKTGEFRNDVSASTMLAAMGGFSNGIVFKWIRSPDDIDIDTAIREVQQLFLFGVRSEGRRS